MAYKVINRFRDKSTGTYYEVGDTYPKKGKASKKRLTELSEKHEKYGVSFIQEVEEGE